MYEPETNISEDDLELYADYTGINNMTLREVIDYKFETNIDEFSDD